MLKMTKRVESNDVQPCDKELVKNQNLVRMCAQIKATNKTYLEMAGRQDNLLSA